MKKNLISKFLLKGLAANRTVAGLIHRLDRRFSHSPLLLNDGSTKNAWLHERFGVHYGRPISTVEAVKPIDSIEASVLDGNENRLFFVPEIILRGFL